MTPRRLADRPLLRTADVLETVPGLLISQHSGEGKANQYYLRGFNLDHGTDFATTVVGVPVNMPTNAHGQGYSDLNFLIPELISGVEYRKGAYSVEDGDFSSAGSAHIFYRDSLQSPLVTVTGGAYGYRRALAALSPRLGPGHVLGAVEFEHNDGPWAHPDDYRKINGMLRYGLGGFGRLWRISAMGYDGRWNSTDQIPERAVASGFVSRLGAIDSTDGGTSYRYSLSAEFESGVPGSVTRASAFAVAYNLDLFSDFTYFLNDAIHGDQFEQVDHRTVAGLHVSHTSDRWLEGQIVTVGLDARYDDIPEVGLYRVEARRRLAPIRVDRVFEASASPYVEDNVQWTQDLRTLIGLRAEGYRFNVASSYAPFSGVGNAGLVSPKVSIVMGPWGALDVYVNGGYGFHSTDVRGARFKASSPASFGGVSAAPEHFPVPGGPSIQFAPLLTRTRGAELGARLTGGSRASISAALWELEIASEHVFLGDAGFSSPSRPSRRTGIELSNEVRPVPGVHVDADLAYSRARFTDRDPAGDRIPGAVEGVASAGIEYEHPSGEFAGLRLRYFGPRPLIEDNSVRSHASTVLNADLGYTVRRTWAVTFQVFNVLDAKVSDVDYYYTSRLPGEPAQGIADIHFHPQEPRSIRFIVSEGAVR